MDCNIFLQVSNLTRGKVEGKVEEWVTNAASTRTDW